MRTATTIVLALLLVAPALATDQHEPDDSFENASWHATDGTHQYHTFHDSTDEDYIKFNLTAGTVYEIETHNHTDIDITDTNTTLYDPDQAYLTQNDDAGAERTSRYLLRAPRNGTYTLKIHEWSGNTSGNYSLTITERGAITATFETSNTTIRPNTTFTASANVTCTGGPCGNVTVTLDPEPRIDPRARKHVAKTGSAPVIITYEQKRRGAASTALNALPSQAYKTRRSLAPQQESATINHQGLRTLANTPGVERVEYDMPVHTLLDNAVDVTNASSLWNTTVAGQNITGHGQTVCVIDTGINYTHPDFGSCNRTSNINDGSCEKVVGGYDYVNNDNDPMDDQGHGSHVAGIAASQNDTYRGVAPDAKLVAIKALNSAGSGFTSDILSGMDWCTSNAESLNITVISMSLGGAVHSDSCTGFTSYEQRFKAARDKNITVTVASGNDGIIGQSSPACVANATSVGATTDSDGYASFSNIGVSTDTLAPGVNIRATNYAGGHVDKSGTSMATPHAAGAAALLKQHFSLTWGRSADARSVDHWLSQYGAQLTDTSYSNLTATRLDAYAGVGRKGVVPTTPGATPFWTPSTNPARCELAAGEDCTVSWTVNATGPDDTYEFFAIVENGYARLNTSSTDVSIQTDVTPPNTSDDAPSGWQNESYNVSLSASDDYSGVDHTSYKLDDDSWVNGTSVSINASGNHSITYYSVDNAGNVEDNTTVFAALDAVPPSTSDDAPSGWQNASLNVSLSATDNESGVNHTSYKLDGNGWQNGTNFSVSGEANHTLLYYSTDQVGNAESANNVSVLIDTTPPSTSDDAPGGWQNASFNVTLTPSDASSGTSHTTYRVDGGAWQNGTSVMINSSGNHSITYYSVDNAGNAEANTTVYAALDASPPSTSDDAPSSWQNASVNVTLSPTDTHSGVNHTSYKLDAGGWQNGTNFSVSGAGAHNATYYSVDDVGNAEANTTVQVRIDTTPPSTSDDAPGGWQNESYNVTLSASDSLSGTSHTSYKLDNNTWVNGTSVSITTDGNHTITYYSVDGAGNAEANTTVYAALDTAPPSTAPAINQSGVNDSDTDGNIELDWSADPDADSYRVYRANTEITDASGLFALATTANTSHVDSQLMHGQSFWYAVTSVDAAGNENASVTSSSYEAVANDTVLPKNPTSVQAATLANGAVNVSWNALLEDVEGSPDAVLRWRVWKAENRSLLSASNASQHVANTTTNHTTDTDITTNQTAYYAVTFVDDAENENTSVLATNTVNITPAGCTTSWSNWSEWTECSGGEQTRNRTRTCHGGGATVDTETQSCEDGSGGSGGGGGGGGGGGLSTQDASATEQTVSLRYFSAGEHHALSLGSDAIALRTVSLTTEEDGFVETLTVRKDEDASDFDGEQYQTVSIEHSQDLTVSNVSISFSVNASWLEERGTEAGDVRLYRREDSTWRALETTIDAKGARAVNYTAYSPGLSRFVIGTQATPDEDTSGEATTQPAPSNEEPPAAKPAVEQPAAQNQSTVSRGEHVPAPANDADVVFWSFALLFASLIVVAYFVLNEHLEQG